MLLCELADGIFAYQASLLLLHKTLLQALFVAIEDLNFTRLEDTVSTLNVLSGGGVRLVSTVACLSIESLSYALGRLA